MPGPSSGVTPDFPARARRPSSYCRILVIRAENSAGNRRVVILVAFCGRNPERHRHARRCAIGRWVHGRHRASHRVGAGGKQKRIKHKWSPVFSEFVQAPLASGVRARSRKGNFPEFAGDRVFRSARFEIVPLTEPSNCSRTSSSSPAKSGDKRPINATPAGPAVKARKRLGSCSKNTRNASLNWRSGG